MLILVQVTSVLQYVILTYFEVSENLFLHAFYMSFTQKITWRLSSLLFPYFSLMIVGWIGATSFSM